MTNSIQTEPIGSIPRPAELVDGLKAFSAGMLGVDELNVLFDRALKDTIKQTTDDCGFSPFADDLSTSRDIAFEKIRARVEGTRLAEVALQRVTKENCI